MTAYLGPLGNLVGFACPSEEQIEQADNVSTEVTLGGVQKAQYGQRAPRSWRVGIGTATPEQVGALTGLLRGLYGPPPWTYVGPWAQVSNLLTPAASLFLPGSSWFSPSGAVASGAVEIDGAPTPSYSLIDASAGNTYTAPFPVVPGIPVTASVWAKGNTSYSLSIAYINTAGTYFAGSPVKAFPAPASGPLVRNSVTATPPAGAATARLLITGALRMAQPAATWTQDTAPWVAGEGAPTVIARGLSKAVQLAVRESPAMRRTSASFTLDEVGNA